MSLLRNPEAVDRFAAHFAEQDSGNFLYKPPGASTGLVISYSEYATLVERFERRLRTAMVLSWIVLLGGGFWGTRAYLKTGSLLSFFIPVAIGVAIVFLLSLRTHLEVLRPLEKQRRAMEKGEAVSRTRH